MLCTSCGEDAVLEMTEQAQTVCTRCGTVLSENAIVSDIQFGETGSGAAVVQGSYVSHDQSGFASLRGHTEERWSADFLLDPPGSTARARAPAGYRQRGIATQESREQTLANGVSLIYRHPATTGPN